MIYDSTEYSKIYEGFRKGRDWLNDVSVEIVNGENHIPPMDLLRYYEADPTLDNNAALASQLCVNREVKFIKAGKVIHSFIYNGGDLSAKFENVPWLYDLFLKVAYGILVKKLTPPSEDSESEEKR